MKKVSAWENEMKIIDSYLAMMAMPLSMDLWALAPNLKSMAVPQEWLE
jgi:hypothetical protein